MTTASRDLTGVDLRPTREFPVDPANEAGFDNSGESLSMSPATGQEVPGGRATAWPTTSSSSPTGFAFATAHDAVADTDRDKYCVNRIIDVLQTPARPTYADYFLAAWRLQVSRCPGPSGRRCIADFAGRGRAQP